MFSILYWMLLLHYFYSCVLFHPPPSHPYDFHPPPPPPPSFTISHAGGRTQEPKAWKWLESGPGRNPVWTKAQCSGKCCLENQVRRIQVLHPALSRWQNCNHHSHDCDTHAAFVKGQRGHLTTVSSKNWDQTNF